MKLKKSLITFAVVLLPLNESSFKILKYKKIPENRVKWKNGIIIEVDKSANPIFYFLKKPTTISQVKLAGTINQINIPKELNQKDDFLLRVAPIFEGGNKLGMMQKMFAADWLIELYDEASKLTESGIDDINFFAIGEQDKLGQKVENEYFGLKINTLFNSSINNNQFELNIPGKKDKKLLGFWISSDGDGSNAKFEITINKIKIYSEENK